MTERAGEVGEGWGANLRTVIRDGEPQWQLRCPDCGKWGDIDDDQFHGRASVDHTTGFEGEHLLNTDRWGECTYHEKRDWFSLAVGKNAND